MKFFYLPLMLVSAVGAGYFFLSSGEPVAENDAASLPPFEAEVPLPQREQKTPVVFKWQDKRGAWHYADAPPADSDATTLMVNPEGAAVAIPPAAANEHPAPRS